MVYHFEIIDRYGRIIYMTTERWKHIVTRHPEFANQLERIKQTVLTPSFQVQDRTDQDLHYLHTFIKEEKMYLIVAVKYLNGEGFIVTTFTSKNRKK